MLIIILIIFGERPELLDETLRDARIIAEALDGVWAHLDRILRHAQARRVPDGSIRVRRLRGTCGPAPATPHDAALLPTAATQTTEMC